MCLSDAERKTWPERLLAAARNHGRARRFHDTGSSLAPWLFFLGLLWAVLSADVFWLMPPEKFERPQEWVRIHRSVKNFIVAQKMIANLAPSPPTRWSGPIKCVELGRGVWDAEGAVGIKSPAGQEVPTMWRALFRPETSQPLYLALGAREEGGPGRGPSPGRRSSQESMKKPPLDARRQKRTLVLLILGLGMGVALLGSAWAGLILGKGYPESYVLGPPAVRFNDFTNETLMTTLPNPYEDPFALYPPATYVFLRAFTYSDRLSLIFVCFFSVTALALPLSRALQPITPGTWARVSLTFLFLTLSYPVLVCLDRGNIEIILAAFMAWAIYFYRQRREVEGTVCLFPAICLKLYPAFLLVLLLRRRKIGLAVLCGAGAIAVTALACCLFPNSPGVIWSSYRQNLDFYRNYDILNNGSLEGSASPWNAYKIVLVTLHKMEFIPPVNFSFDGPLILASYRVYVVVLALVALVCAGYAWFWERKLARSAIMLLLFLSMAAPSGADYRLIYAFMALLLLMLLPQPRRGDGIALVLLALAMIPKKEILLTFIGRTETGYADVPVQSLLNPVLILAAMGILLGHSRHLFAWRRLARRFPDLFHSNWKWSQGKTGLTNE